MSLAEYIYTEILKPKPLKALTNFILLRIIPEKIRIGPGTMHLDRTDPVVSGALTLGVFEPSELDFFQKYCREGMTFVDVGANLGLYSVLAIHSLNKQGRIIAFEPHPRNFSIFQQNIEENLHSRQGAGPQVDAFQLAAAPAEGKHELRLNPENRADNRLYHGTYQGKIEDWASVSVEGKAIDEVLASLGVNEVNFVKMDIQGYEQQALAGFKETLARSQKVILMTEFWPKGLREAGGDAFRYLQELADLGFHLYELKEKPRGKFVKLESWVTLVNRLVERKYANLIGVKGYTLP